MKSLIRTCLNVMRRVGPRDIKIAAALFGVLPVVITLPWYRNPLRALLAPIAIYGMLPILYGGMISALSGSGVEWKGRVV